MKLTTLNTKSKIILANIFVLLFLSIQLLQSIYHRNDWPFSSFAMYSETLAYENRYIVVVAHFEEGPTEVLLPWDLLPIDYYKTMGLLKSTFMQRVQTELSRDQFAALLSSFIERKGLKKLDFISAQANNQNLRNIFEIPKNHKVIFTHQPIKQSVWVN